MDALAPDFELNPENFVIHSHSNRGDYLTHEDDRRSNGKSGRFTSVTVGKMPGRQVIVYDKRREVIDKKKPIWWDIWNANLRRDDLPLLDASDAATSRVWRIEIRAGKNLLKDRWQVRTWAQLDTMFGDIVAEALEKVRYCEPSDDGNRARWPNHALWDLVAATTDDDLMEMRSFVDPSGVKDVHRNEHIRLILAQVVGNATTLAALEGVSEIELIDYMEHVGARLATVVEDDQEHAARKLNEAKGRYRFIA
ncbi:hypothetical protein [Shimia sp. Alg240-R146]|uniref:hypothetical protein n=1 Tax=Shimia sp. Alg240-R146 TaxID=2993449 RepID=UPI0022E8A69C|nr:hypothetical protein [Shimia sp. Alg240-R146]